MGVAAMSQYPLNGFMTNEFVDGTTEIFTGGKILGNLRHRKVSTNVSCQGTLEKNRACGFFCKGRQGLITKGDLLFVAS